MHWFPHSVRFPLFSQWIRYWASVIFLTIFLLATLFPQVHRVGFFFTQFSRYLTFQELSIPQSVNSVFNFDILAWLCYLIILFSESKSEWQCLNVDRNSITIASGESTTYPKDSEVLPPSWKVKWPANREHFWANWRVSIKKTKLLKLFMSSANYWWQILYWKHGIVFQFFTICW